MTATLESMTTSAYRIPTEKPVSDGTLDWNHTTMVLVQVTSEGKTGLGYTYSDASCAKLIHEVLAPCLCGRAVLNISAAWEEMHRIVRNFGHQGLTAMGMSAVDTALWDLKAKLLGVSVADLLGRVRNQVEVYGSGGFTSFSSQELKAQFEAFADRGIQSFKMKVGRRPSDDVSRVAEARRIIGDAADLFVDANGAYGRQQALKKAIEFQDYGVTWFEEPVGSDDFEGLRLLRRNCPAGMEVTTGEYGFDLYSFHRWCREEVADVLQIDVTRCGGITNFLRIHDLLMAFNIPVSTHTAPALHRCLGLSLPQIRHLEYFADHVRIEKMAYSGFEEAKEGKLSLPEGMLGLGLDLNEHDIKEYEVYRQLARPIS